VSYCCTVQHNDTESAGSVCRLDFGLDPLERLPQNRATSSSSTVHPLSTSGQATGGRHATSSALSIQQLRLRLRPERRGTSRDVSKRSRFMTLSQADTKMRSTLVPVHRS
jgi:hypothetical protein